MKKNIPMVDLKKQYKSIKKDIDKAVSQVLNQSAFIGGPFVEKLEDQISKYCNTLFAVGLNSGTDALYLSLWSLGIGKGDEVIIPTFTFFATAEAVALLGARPVFIDIDPHTFNLNADLLEKKINKKTRAIIPVHLFGQMAEMDKIMKIAKKYKLFVVEDAAQAIGSEFKNKKAGTWGEIGCFSFYPTKNLGAYGDGGMIITNNKEFADKIRMLRNHGSIVKYDNETIGINSRLDGIQASLLSAKLKYLDKWNKKRRAAACLYNQNLKNISNIKTPFEADNIYHTYHQYTIRVENNKRDKLKQNLLKNKVSSMIYYPKPLHLLKAFDYLKYKKGDFPESEKASEEVLSLPIYPEITKKEISLITKIIKLQVL